MDFGLFLGPYSLEYELGQRTAHQVIDWDVTMARWGDELGLSEVFFAEHYTIGYQPSPAPDLMIATAAAQTERIKLGAAAHLLPYHHPGSLAFRLMWLDHITQGRYVAGFAPGSYPSDAQLFDTGESNPEMMVEALDVIDAIWTRKGPWRIEGKHWTIDMPEFDERWSGPHLRPFQDPHPEVVLTGMQPQSPTFAEAGKRGYAPMSQEVGAAVLSQQWDFYASVMEDNGHTPDRANWRVLRDYFVAETDEEARRLVLEGPAGRTWAKRILPVFKFARERNGKTMALGDLLLEPGMTLDDLTLEWLVDNFWLVGSPETVIEKTRKLNEDVGGLGTILSFGFDYSDDPAPFRRSLELLSTEVLPQLEDVGARAGAAAASSSQPE